MTYTKSCKSVYWFRCDFANTHTDRHADIQTRVKTTPFASRRVMTLHQYIGSVSSAGHPRDCVVDADGGQGGDDGVDALRRL